MGMDYLYASLLGVVQGITEFLPVSSSAHLLLLHHALHFNIGSDLAFDVALHAGTLVAIVVFFYGDIIQYFRHSPKLIWLTLLSTLPAGIIGWFFQDAIDTYLRSAWVVVVMLVLVSVVFFIVEAKAQTRLQLKQLTWPQALLLGCAQALALIPGTSRSGITMSAGMAFGLARVEAARFSFIMTIPLLLAVTAKDGLDVAKMHWPTHDLLVMLVGAVVAALVGLVVIRYLLQFFQQYTLRPFAWYRIALAVVVSLMLLF